MGHPKLAFAAERADSTYRLRLARYQGLAEALAELVRAPRASARPKLELLDVGVGNGRTLRYCEAVGVADQIAFHGIDNSRRRLAGVYGLARWQLKRADVQDGLPFPDSRFDVVVCEQVLEHLTHPEAVISEMLRVLVPGGLLVVGVPIFRPAHALIRKTLVPKLDRWRGIRRDHVQVFTLRSFRQLLDRAGSLTVQDVRGFRISSGGPIRFLENSHAWYQLNRFLGRHFPGSCTEVQILATKRHSKAA